MGAVSEELPSDRTLVDNLTVKQITNQYNAYFGSHDIDCEINVEILHYTILTVCLMLPQKTIINFEANFDVSMMESMIFHVQSEALLRRSTKG